MGCRKVRDKAGLIRLHRSADGRVEADLSGGRRGGRGAYLCPEERCLEAAQKKGRLAHAFRAPVTVEAATWERLHALFAARQGSEAEGGAGRGMSPRSGVPFEGGA